MAKKKAKKKVVKKAVKKKVKAKAKRAPAKKIVSRTAKPSGADEPVATDAQLSQAVDEVDDGGMETHSFDDDFGRTDMDDEDPSDLI